MRLDVWPPGMPPMAAGFGFTASPLTKTGGWAVYQPLCQVLPVALQRVSWPFLQRMSWDLEKGEDSKRVFKFQFNFFEAPRLRPWFSRKADLFLFGNVSSRSLVLRFFNTGARVWWKARPLWALWWFWAHPGGQGAGDVGVRGGDELQEGRWTGEKMMMPFWSFNYFLKSMGFAHDLVPCSQPQAQWGTG